MAIVARPVFSGHDTFQCRHLWLKKGYDYIKSGKSFNAEDAVVELGVGKNMVTSIRYWMRAFNLLDINDDTTEFAHQFFSDEGFDPYLEDEATLWLLHYQLVKRNYATTYNILFNEFRKERIEFTKEQFWQYIKYKFDGFVDTKGRQNTVDSDFITFTKMYVGDIDSKDKEDMIAGILTELNLVKYWSKNKDKIFTIEPSERKEIPNAVLLYSLTENEKYGISIDFQTILSDWNSPGSIFALNENGLYDKMESIAAEYADIVIFKDDAGIRELQFKGEKPSPYTILKVYYANAN
jgi:hypothetical protein